jgi:hypothetical protein
MFAILAHIRPLDKTTGARVDVYVSSAPGAAFAGLNGVYWEPAISERPSGSITLMTPDLSAGTQVGSMDMALSFTALKQVDGRKLYWQDAPIVLYRADDMTWPATVEFTGYVVTAAPDLDADTIKLSSSVPTSPIEVDILTLAFDGSGGAGGDAALRGTLKPIGFGVCANIQPVFFDTVRNIGMIDGYGNTVSIDWLAEGLSKFGARVADYPTYAALAAAIDAGTVGPGQWGTSVAAGLIGLGAPPVGVITCAAHFKYGMTGALMARLLTTFAGVGAQVDTASFTAIDTMFPYPIHYWTADQIQVKDLNEALANACNAAPLVTFQGLYSVTTPFGGPLVGTLVRNGFNEPQITAWATKDVIEPTWQLKARAGRPVSVLTIDQVNYYDNLVDRGLYSATEQYRQGNIVWLANKSEWLYINVTPSAGHAPPDPSAGNAYWQNLAPAPDADVLLYGDGTPIGALQPAEPAAQVTRSLTLADSALTFVLDASGSPVAGQLPFTTRATVNEANYDVTLTSSYSIVASTGITASVDNGASSTTRGQITITGVTQAGTIKVTALKSGVVMTQTLSISTKGVLADNSAVSTDLIEGGAVTETTSIETTTSYAGSGSPPSTTNTVVLSVTFTPGEDMNLLIFANGNLDYSGSADFGAQILVDGVAEAIVAGGAGYPIPSFSRQTAKLVTAGSSHTVALTFRGSANVSLAAAASLIIFKVKR